MDDLKTKWVKALRSGDYKQGALYLKSNDNYFCCLGVLADIAGVEWEPLFNEDRFAFMNEAGDYFWAGLSESLRKKSGITHDNEIVLITMNDRQDKTFEEIADYIEKELV